MGLVSSSSTTNVELTKQVHRCVSWIVLNGRAS
jgi:hypothetical protein